MVTVDVNFAKKTATITTKGTQQLSKEQVERALKAKGYGVVDFTPQTQPAGAGS